MKDGKRLRKSGSLLFEKTTKKYEKTEVITQ